MDKIDYLIRDSIHCGVNYGKGIDVERLLDSLYIDSDKKKICLTEKGRSMLLSILSCRNIMYQEVYWHKTVRAYTAMFKRFLYEFVSNQVLSPDEIESLFNYSDDEFVYSLYETSTDEKYNHFNHLIKPFRESRKIYKPAFVYYHGSSIYSDKPNICQFFEKLNTLPYKKQISFSKEFTKKIKPYLANVKENDIILEITPIRKRKDELEGFTFWDNKVKCAYEPTTEIKTLNKYLGNHYRSYIFCHPRHYNKMKEFIQGDKQKKLDEICGKLL